jgi:hypothetical protein
MEAKKNAFRVCAGKHEEKLRVGLKTSFAVVI